jgi:hypothetical protein
VDIGLLDKFQSGAFVFRPLTPRIIRSFFTLSNHLRLDLRTLLLPPGFGKVSFLHEDVLFVLIKCSSLELPQFDILQYFRALYKLYSSQFYLIRHPSFSVVGP